MLDVGTKVFVKILFKEDRPDDTRHNLYSNTYFGTILEQLGNNYYLVGANVSDNSTSGVIHEDEMVNMDLYKPKFEVGEVVRIRQIPYQEKEIFNRVCRRDGLIYRKKFSYHKNAFSTRYV